MRNSEILFIYDAFMCNPNGDPDNENKPRMDWASQRNLVSDVRLKRYIRDYLYEVKGLDIFVRKENGKHVDATTRVESLGIKDKDEDKIRQGAIQNWIDVRLFGATLPIKGAKGLSVSLTGPVQFTWGYSLNKVEILDSSSITSILSGAETGGGNIGKDWRVKYSLIAFYGRINGRTAKDTGMSEEDLKLLDEAIWESIKQQTNTRSKLGQYPRLYIRIEFKDDTIIGDLRRFVRLENEDIDSPEKVELDIRPLNDELKKLKERIERIVLMFDDTIKINGIEELSKML